MLAKQTLRRKRLFLCLAVLFGVCLIGSRVRAVISETAAPGAVSEIQALQQHIDAKSSEIKKLAAEADKYRQTIATSQIQAASLKADIARINATIAKLQKDIKITQTKIQKTNLEVEQLGISIDDTKSKIALAQARLAEFMRSLARADETSSLEILLQHVSFSEFFNTVQAGITVQDSVRNSLETLKVLNNDLVNQKQISEAKVSQLKQYDAVLADQKKIQQNQQDEKNQVLAATKNQEQVYQNLLADNEKRRQALEDEINTYQKQLNPNFNINSIPKARVGVLGWPVPKDGEIRTQCGHTTYSYVTQCFGDTNFARAGAYSGKGHNGVDFRADYGTEVYAAEDGVVRGSGNTDIGCRGASYGQWILIDHDDGLSTLYGHLSLVKVVPGEHVARGDVIAYSGKTGYATGPHLHVSAFAADAVEIGTIRSKVCGRNMTLPLSPFNGYLDPLNYL
ncbi:MAG: peptidoglycan DD-metalloendopeptidase family protein [Candidatus Sungbacteria bacterium]|uniref:Peptidoglycan DD-metalloendopeptidase family protein n=1 Tax=Candidatus Sungiibacteriota bacterium TaxID=2750080 RepID=A0A9D6LQS4_9BACT|nr:peptidoglycan DD-metalloendopeptidase family protein [Candidatus Sungbacteria bacterium]